MNKKLRILLADDSKFFRAIEAKFLEKTPVEIIEATACEEVLEVLSNARPDLVYMAFSLPAEGGAACCRTIKADPALKAVPVVLICDQGAAEQPELARRASCDAVLTKPLDRHSFLQIGRQFLEGIREHRQPSFFRVAFRAGDAEFAGKCLDISSGGMFIETQADLLAGCLINLEFRLPDGLSAQFVCTGEVMWLNRRPNPMKPHYPIGLGVKFVNVPEALKRAVTRLSDKKPIG